MTDQKLKGIFQELNELERKFSYLFDDEEAMKKFLLKAEEVHLRLQEIEKLARKRKNNSTFYWQMIEQRSKSLQRQLKGEERPW